MNNLTFQTHSVYRDRQSGEQLLLIHHNPMNLCSLLLPYANGAFDASRPQKTGVDTIIAIRKSGNFEELSPLPETEFKSILRELLACAGPDDRPFVQALIDQMSPQ